MKTQFQVKTAEFEYIMQEADGLSAEEAVMAYRALQRAVKGEPGLEQKDWNRAVDRYLSNGGGETETWAKMSDKQKWFINEVKKAFARLEDKK